MDIEKTSRISSEGQNDRDSENANELVENRVTETCVENIAEYQNERQNDIDCEFTNEHDAENDNGRNPILQSLNHRICRINICAKLYNCCAIYFVVECNEVKEEEIKSMNKEFTRFKKAKGANNVDQVLLTKSETKRGRGKSRGSNYNKRDGLSQSRSK
ncbi:Uncharacterized protein Fot_14515 [Forsythia ovata]|uniref:Uncharacterized protein n=1 Tax=Forsythia ovata TaxID=205694 RepID=A0ABD1W6V1_9LAMI